MSEPMRLAMLSLAMLLLASCAEVSSEVSKWNGTLSYNPVTGKVEMTFSRPGGVLPVPSGYAK